MNSILFIVVIISSIWVYIDARSIGAKKGLTKGLFDIGPFGWALCCLLFWIIAFPAYLIKRGDIKRAVASNEESESKPKRDLKRCPFCGEEIQKQAVFCRFCKKELTETEQLHHTRSGSLIDYGKVHSGISQKEKGMKFLKDGNYAEAVNAFTQAIQELSPSEIYYARGVAYSKLNRQADMLSDIKTAAMLGSTKAKAALDKVKNK